MAKWDKKADIHEPTQKAIIVYDAGVEDLILQVRYTGPVEEFGWLIPLPDKPSIEKASMESFYELSRLVQKGVKYGRHSPLDSGKDITVHEYRTVGDYEVAILSARNVEALAAWLTQHDFQWPDQGREIARAYLEKGWFFVAARVKLGDAAGEDVVRKLKTGELHPLKLTFRTPQCVYPLRISSLNDGDSGVHIYMLSRSAPYVCPDMDFFLFQDSYGLHRQIPFFGAFADDSALVKDLPRLKRHPWHLYKHYRNFQPGEMHDLVFKPIDEAQLGELAETFFAAHIPDPLPRRLDNKTKDRIAAAAYLAPRTFARAVLQLCPRNDAFNNLSFMAHIDWAQARADPKPIARALAEAWAGVKDRNLTEATAKTEREAYFGYLRNMTDKAAEGIPMLAREMTRVDMVATYHEAYAALARFLHAFPNREATGCLVDLFKARRKASPETWDDPEDWNLVRALGLTQAPEAATAMGPYLNREAAVSRPLVEAIRAIKHPEAEKVLAEAIRACGFSDARAHLFNALWSLDEDAAFERVLDWIDRGGEGQEDVIRRLAERNLADRHIEALGKRADKLWPCASTDAVFRRYARQLENAGKMDSTALEKQLATLVRMRRRLSEPRNPEPLDQAIARIVLQLHE